MRLDARFVVFALCLSAPLEVAAASFIAEYPVPSPASRPAGIGGSVAGVIWFTEFAANKIARIDPQGVITETALPTPGSGPWDVMASPDVYGSVIFTEFNASKIGRISLDGKLTEVALPADSGPRGISLGPGYSSIWFAEFNADKIGGFIAESSGQSIDGRYTEVALSPGSRPIGVTVGPGGVSTSPIWFTEFGGNKIGRIDPRGILAHEYVIPTPNSGPTGITAAQNGQGAPFAVWFTEVNANQIGRITEDGQILEIPIPTPDSGPVGISSDGSGAVWFAESRGNKIARVNPDNTITEFPLPTPAAGPTAILENWIVESDANRIGRLGADWLVAVGAGHAGAWDTRFSLANAREQNVTTSVGLRPSGVCPGICLPHPATFSISGRGTLTVSASNTPTFETFDTFVVTTALSPDEDLPITRARIVNRNVPSRSAEIPVMRFSTIRKLNPSVLTFPGASRGPGSYSNLVLAEVSGEGAVLSLSIQAYSAGGEPAGASYPISLGVNQTIELVDVLSVLGISTLDGGQIRVTKTGGTGLLWGLLATSSDDGTLSTSSGINP